MGPHPAAISLIVIAAVLLLVGALRSVWVQALREDEERSIDELQLRIDALEGEDAARRMVFIEQAQAAIRVLAEFADASNNHTRLSGYVHNGGGWFVQFARESPNPALRVPGRGIYPDDEGIVAEAWQHGRAHCVDIDATKSPSIHETRFGMSSATVGGFTMKTRSLFAIRVEDAAEHSQKHVGVIVFESTRKRGVGEIMMENLLKSGQWAALQMQLSTGRNYLPNTFEASKEGF